MKARRTKYSYRRVSLWQNVMYLMVVFIALLVLAAFLK